MLIVHKAMLARLDSDDSKHISRIALLCVADGDGQYGDNVALAMLYGKPLIFYQIKRLYALGINRFFIAIDSVSGILLALADELRGQAIDIEFVRSPNDLAIKIDSNSLIWVQSAHIWIDQDIARDFLAQARPSILTVEEHAENQKFERIDLNTRWSGIMVIDHATLASISSLPDGWDIGSSLLRQAMQVPLEHIQLRQQQVNMGQISYIQKSSDLSAISAVAWPQMGWLEDQIAPHVAKPVLSWLGENEQIKQILPWVFPIVSGLSAGVAALGSAAVALALLPAAILLALLRSYEKSTDFHISQKNMMDSVGWAMVALATFFCLSDDLTPYFEAIFLTFAIVAVALLANEKRSKFTTLFSPLAISLFLLLGYHVGTLHHAVQLAIIIGLLFLLIPEKQNQP